MKSLMVQIPLELSRIYVINSKERELKMLNHLRPIEEEVQLNTIRNHKIDNDPHLPTEVAEEDLDNPTMLQNSILKLLI